MLCKFRQNAKAGPMAQYLGSRTPGRKTQDPKTKDRGPETPAPATQDLVPGTPRPII